jgi:DNA-binding response OmpR family regulator
MIRKAKKILIVEDEEDILEFLSMVFRLDGYEVLRARDGEEALSIARANNNDIILLDIQLPKLNGYEVCQSVKSDPTISSTKVLMMSGITQNLDRTKAQKVGADDFIAKPFSTLALSEKVEALLKRD